MKETKLEIPADCEVDKIEMQDGHIVVTFKEKERKLPKSWEEFCEMYQTKADECYIDDLSEIKNGVTRCVRRIERDENLLPNRATAEAVLTLCQLIQLRDCYNGDWVPDWDCNNGDVKYFIEFYRNDIIDETYVNNPSSMLYFKSEELRDEFLRYFRPLIEKLKPLYGIKEGGEE